MKKTLITILAIAAVSVASATEYTTTTGYWDGGHGKGNYYGWSGALSGPGYLSTTPSALPEEVSLNSISILHADSGTGPLAGGSKLAIFTFTDSGTVGSLVGISSNIVTNPAASERYTYTFTGVTLTSTTQYRFLFVDDAATADNFSTAEGADNKAAWQAVAGQMRLQLEDLAAGYASGAGVVTSTDLALYTEGYKPNVTYVTASVPEPATATLSLLALAGLAARRRRK